MNSKEYFWAVIGIIGLVLFIACIIISSLTYESINIGSLDRVCRELMGNPNAKYYSEFGLQDGFKCKKNNEIIIIKKHARFNI